MVKQEYLGNVVGYLGPEGTFCELAGRKYFPKADLVPYKSVDDVFANVENRSTEFGIVPVENSTDGSVPMTLDCLLETKLMIYGEVELKIVHNLIVKSETKLNKIEIVLSHPQGLAQCHKFLRCMLPTAELREVSSTAKAVEMLRDLDNAAAIGSKAAAERSGMVILKSGIEDETNNVTRFLILSEKDAKPTGNDKTSVIFSSKHVPGSLYRVLEIFAIKEINLTKIESRPEKRRPWNYIFYLDFEGHRTDSRIIEALNSMGERCTYVKVLGSYPKAS